MRSHRVLIAAIGAVFTLGCATRVPRPAGVPPGAAYVTWIIMSGNRDNPDQDFVCQSDRKDECVIPVSRPDAQVFSDVHFYYHAERADTTYAGSMEVGFFQGPIGIAIDRRQHDGQEERIHRQPQHHWHRLGDAGRICDPDWADRHGRRRGAESAHPGAGAGHPQVT